MGKHLFAFVGGVYGSFLHFLGSSYVETAIKGLIGGLAGYIGTEIMTLIIKTVKNRKSKNKNKKQ